MQNLMANITSFSPWPEQHEVGSGAILPCNYIIRPLPSTYDQSVETVFPKRKQEVPQEQCHINRINMIVYFSFNVYQSSHDTFYCVFISDFQYKTDMLLLFY